MASSHVCVQDKLTHLLGGVALKENMLIVMHVHGIQYCTMTNLSEIILTSRQGIFDA